MLSEEADIQSVIIIIGCVVSVKIIISIKTGVSLWRKSIRSVNVAKFYLIVLLLLSIISSFMPLISNVYLGLSRTILLALAIESTVLSAGFFTIWYLYLCKSKRIKETYPTTPNNSDILSYKSFVKMFDKTKHKVNHYMFAGLFIFKFFSIFTFGIVFLIFNPTGHFILPYQVFLIAIFIGFLYSVFFMLISYISHRDWILIIIWPLIYALLTAIYLFFHIVIFNWTGTHYKNMEHSFLEYHSGSPYIRNDCIFNWQYIR